MSGDLLNTRDIGSLAGLGGDLVGSASGYSSGAATEGYGTLRQLPRDTVELLAHLRNVDVRVDCDVLEVTLDGLAKILPSVILLAQRARHVAKRGERLVPDLLGQRLRETLG